MWQSRAQDGDGCGVFGQRFDSAGTPLGGEFQVNSTTTADQRYPRVAMDAAGNFVVVWSGEDTYGSYSNVRARRFDSAGVAQGLEFEVAAADTAEPRTPAVSMTGTGDFVVVWDAVVSGNDRAILGRRYDSAGTPLGGAIQVSQALSYFTEGPTWPPTPTGASSSCGTRITTSVGSWGGVSRARERPSPTSSSPRRGPSSSASRGS